jgi:hypothetical protein
MARRDLLITFTRDKQGGDRHTTRIERDDGTSTWSYTTPFFVEHDLLHFAVETTLGLRAAFWGLMNQGWEISSFEERQPGSPKAVQLPEEAYRAECLVGMIHVDWLEGPFPWPEFQRLVKESYGGEDILSEDQLKAIRSLYGELLTRWRSTPAGGTLEVVFDATL